MQFPLFKLLEPTSERLGLLQYLATDIPNSSLLPSHELQTWHYVAIAFLWITTIVVVGILSPRIEHTIIFAIVLSVILGVVLTGM